MHFIQGEKVIVRVDPFNTLTIVRPEIRDGKRGYWCNGDTGEPRWVPEDHLELLTDGEYPTISNYNYQTGQFDHFPS